MPPSSRAALSLKEQIVHTTKMTVVRTLGRRGIPAETVGSQVVRAAVAVEDDTAVSVVGETWVHQQWYCVAIGCRYDY